VKRVILRPVLGGTTSGLDRLPKPFFLFPELWGHGFKIRGLKDLADFDLVLDGDASPVIGDRSCRDPPNARARGKRPDHGASRCSCSIVLLGTCFLAWAQAACEHRMLQCAYLLHRAVAAACTQGKTASVCARLACPPCSTTRKPRTPPPALRAHRPATRNRRAAQQLRQGAFWAPRRQIAEATGPAQAARSPEEACTLR
jgi:hypothetical protein